MLAVYHLVKHLRDGGDPAALAEIAALVSAVGATK